MSTPFRARRRVAPSMAGARRAAPSWSGSRHPCERPCRRRSAPAASPGRAPRPSRPAAGQIPATESSAADVSDAKGELSKADKSWSTRANGVPVRHSLKKDVLDANMCEPKQCSQRVNALGGLLLGGALGRRDGLIEFSICDIQHCSASPSDGGKGSELWTECPSTASRHWC